MSAPFDPARMPPDPFESSKPKIPDSVSIAVELWVAVVVGQIVALFAQTGTFVDTVRDQVRSAPPEGVTSDQLEFMTSSGFVVGVLVAMSVFLTAITALIVWFTRKGYNWARIVLSAMGVYVAVSLLFSLFAGNTSPAWAMVPLVISGVAALGATVLLMRGDSETYCRTMAAARKPQPVLPSSTPYPGAPGQNPYGQNPYGQNPYGQNPYGQNPYGQNPYGQNPYGQNPYGRSGTPSQHAAPPGDSPYGDSEHREKDASERHPDSPSEGPKNQ
ncbi:hypothetical protein IA539_11705 [Gordonia sp. zg691]|uniref:Uncharacterized protein n=1 Tax=Gordonia jinghuaiqii TaxID=2758710 RepID=A0A7D7QQZ4_9ACTN|nr:hypothetical protein [Gordonia jinghuaiqii]MBD0861874.1 hypothetical protein [Gordonia jinghuaiqii]MCR5977766.1 hypothetical protein [Gordonia jinghuaiqii]QMT02426.1 hypothetical protein H1R19_04510 [Gordonia jinghuaiqii]